MSEDVSLSGDILSKFTGARVRLLEILLEEQERQGEKERQAEEIKPCIRDEGAASTLLPASAAQRRLWLLDLEGAGAAYYIPLAARLRGPLDQDTLQRSLSALVQRHEILRTVFADVDGNLNQKIQSDARFALQVVDLSGYDMAEREARVRAHKETEVRHPLDLRVGPLIRGRLLRLTADEHVLLLTMHHIVFDAWSMSIFIRELAQLYAAFKEQRNSVLEPLPIQYADFAAWQHSSHQGDTFEEDLRCLTARMDGAPPQIELPTDRPRPAVQSYRGDNVCMVIGPGLSAELKAFAQRKGMTLFMLSYAACAILMSRLSDQEDIVIGTPVANRRRPELHGLIGFFINTLPLRVVVRNDSRIDEFLELIRTTTLEAYDHQDVPFEKLIEALHPQRDPGRNPLFQVMLVVQNAGDSELLLPGLEVTPEELPSGASKFDLLLYFEERGDEVACRANYAVDLFDRESVERWLECLHALLRNLLSEEHDLVGELEIVPQAQLRALESFNATKVDSRHHGLVHQLFEEQALRLPDAIAVVHGQRSLTYAELGQRADDLARLLRKRGIGVGHLVGVCLERSPEMVLGVLGILKSGAAYLPLDPNYPPDRLQHMLEDAAPQVILTQRSLLAVLPAGSGDTILLDGNWSGLDGSGKENTRTLGATPTPDDLVYVIYTSGSTGRPKGTAMPHRSMVNLITWHHSIGVKDGQRVLQFAALSFDVAFQEIFTTLCTGGTLELVDEWVRKDAAALTELLIERSIQRLFVPPLMLQSVAEHATTTDELPFSLSDVITAGEQLRISPEIVGLFKRLNNCRLHNHYGPTETHVVTALTLAEDPEKWPVFPSIGRPIDNTQIHILDVRRRQVPIGVKGEIFIGGAGVARGYLGQPELTAQRFLPDPFCDDSQARLYKTGDVARWHTDGTIEYLGRNDAQVKIRGYRIELGEIEAQLARHPEVKEAAVVVRQDAQGEKRLVAYLTRGDCMGANVNELRTYMKSLLPDYMVPSAFVELERLPLTPSGKLDRRMLPAPAAEAYASTRYEPPQGDIEERVANIWRELLHVERIGRQDNFFELGGHSLLAVKSMFRINKSLGSSLKVTDLYKHATVRELADRICSGVTEDRMISLGQEAVLPGNIVAAPGLLQFPAKAIMLTGGTGFVGRFLLAQLLQDTDATIYCLTRANSEQEAQSRLRSTLLRWQLSCDDYDRRVVAIPGDVRLPHLGIEDRSYRVLSEHVDSIFHCATSMNHLETYATAKVANVDATIELLRLATHIRPKLVNYISTLGVFSASKSHTGRIVNEESSIDHEAHWNSQGYVASKWVGEKIFMTAGERGIPCNIFRVGLVWPDMSRGRYDELQHDYRVFKTCLLSGFGIKNYRNETTPIPVDYAARAMVFLAGRFRSGNGVFHISSSFRRDEGVFERFNDVSGMPLQLKSYYDWICEIKRLHYAGWSLPAVPLIEFAFSLDRETFEAHQRDLQASRVHVDSTRTQKQLEAAGIATSAPDDELIKLWYEDMLARDMDVRDVFKAKGS